MGQRGSCHTVDKVVCPKMAKYCMKDSRNARERGGRNVLFDLFYLAKSYITSDI